MIPGVVLGQMIGSAVVLAAGAASAISTKKTKAGQTLKSSEELKVEQINSASLADDVFAERPKSRIVKWLMTQSSVSTNVLADYLGCTAQTLRNKLSKDSFSLDDILIAAHACGYSLSFVGKDIQENEQNYLVVDPVSYFGHMDNGEKLKRLAEAERRNTVEAQEEYDRLKAELEVLRLKYGFQD